MEKLDNSSAELPVLGNFLDMFTKGGNKVLVLPTLHGQLQFSQLVSRILSEHGIDRILVELPTELEEGLTAAVDRLPFPTIMYRGELRRKGDKVLTPEPGRAYVIHPGEAIYWASFMGRRNGVPVDFIDTYHQEAHETWTAPLGFEHLAAIGWEQFWEEGSYLVEMHLQSEVHQRRSAHMAERVTSAASSSSQLLVVCGAAHWPAVVSGLISEGYEGESMVPIEIAERYESQGGGPLDQDPGNWRLADVHPHTFHLVTSQLPYHLGRLVTDPLAFEMLESIRQLYFDAERRYQQKFDDQVSPASYRRMFQYLRNLGRVQGQVLPDLYNLVAGAKGMVDDDFAFEVYRTAISYPFLPSEDQKLGEELKFTPDEEQGEVIRFAFRRRFKRPVLKKVDDDFDDLDPIPEEDYPGQWQEIWDQHSPYGYVSYPPEDEFIENYMQYLRKRIVEILMEEESATMEFETSLEDGIDWRETMRHYHEGKIYVKKYPKNKYKVGALIVQFLEEPYDTKEYSHHSTLFAEHDQESHISVITTRPGDVMVGPGISRVKYAAIISQFPPVGMPYLVTKQNIDLKLRLIWSAMQMSLNRIIGFVAKKPPTAAQRHFAAEHGFRLVYLPMGQLTGSSLRRLRTMHLLAHRGLRDNAREYIGF